MRGAATIGPWGGRASNSFARGASTAALRDSAMPTTHVVFAARPAPQELASGSLMTLIGALVSNVKRAPLQLG